MENAHPNIGRAIARGAAFPDAAFFPAQSALESVAA